MKKFFKWLLRVLEIPAPDTVLSVPPVAQKEYKKAKEEPLPSLKKILLLIASKRGTLVGTRECVHMYGGSGGTYTARQFSLPVGENVVAHVDYHMFNHSVYLQVDGETLWVGDYLEGSVSQQLIESCWEKLLPVYREVSAEISAEKEIQQR